MAKKFRTDEIPVGKFTEDWGGNKNNTIPAAPDETNLLPYSGEAVQKFIKSYLQDHENNKIGHIPPMTKDPDGFIIFEHLLIKTHIMNGLLTLMRIKH